MATIVTRAGKGSALTFAEVDGNFTGLNSDIATNTSDISTLQTGKFDKAGGTVTGDTTFSANVTSGAKVITSTTANSQSGSNIIITAPSSEVVRLTNNLLVSIDGIGVGSSGQKLTFINATGATVTIENLGTSAATNEKIYTGTGGSLALQDNSSINFVYDGSSSKWSVIGAIPSTVTAVPAGTILSFAGVSAPAGYLLCDGSAISRTSYSSLFAVISTYYGYGDNSTTFNIPDLRWSFLRGRGADISANGSGTAGSNQATFTAHGFNRTGVKVRLSSGTLSGLATSTNYWVIVVDANTLAFATSKANAIANTRVGISGANSAVIVQYEDPDAASRAANTNGANSAASVGSYQDHQFFSHTHNYDRTNITNTAASGTTGTPTGTTSWTSTATTAGGGNETRPMNVSVNYIIKF